MKIVDYKVVTASDPVTLATFVKEHMARNWQPQGGVAYAESGYRWGQVMVKYEAVTFTGP